MSADPNQPESEPPDEPITNEASGPGASLDPTQPTLDTQSGVGVTSQDCDSSNEHGPTSISGDSVLGPGDDHVPLSETARSGTSGSANTVTESARPSGTAEQALTSPRVPGADADPPLSLSSAGEISAEEGNDTVSTDGSTAPNEDAGTQAQERGRSPVPLSVGEDEDSPDPPPGALSAEAGAGRAVGESVATSSSSDQNGDLVAPQSGPGDDHIYMGGMVTSTDQGERRPLSSSESSKVEGAQEADLSQGSPASESARGDTSPTSRDTGSEDVAGANHPLSGSVSTGARRATTDGIDDATGINNRNASAPVPSGDENRPDPTIAGAVAHGRSAGRPTEADTEALPSATPTSTTSSTQAPIGPVTTPAESDPGVFDDCFGGSRPEGETPIEVRPFPASSSRLSDRRPRASEPLILPVSNPCLARSATPSSSPQSTELGEVLCVESAGLIRLDTERAMDIGQVIAVSDLESGANPVPLANRPLSDMSTQSTSITGSGAPTSCSHQTETPSGTPQRPLSGSIEASDTNPASSSTEAHTEALAAGSRGGAGEVPASGVEAIAATMITYQARYLRQMERAEEAGLDLPLNLWQRFLQSAGHNSKTQRGTGVLNNERRFRTPCYIDQRTKGPTGLRGWR